MGIRKTELSIKNMSSNYYEKIPYYKINKILLRWKLCDAASGCYPIPGLAIAMDKAAPAPPGPPASAPPKPPAPQKDFIDHLVTAKQAASRFKKWLDTPDPPKPPKTAPQQKKRDTVPPFDIQEIPDAMRKERMPVGAKVMERWFAGRLNYSPSDEDERAKINQDGKPYPPDMHDTTIVKLDWVLKFERARSKYDYLGPVHTNFY